MFNCYDNVRINCPYFNNDVNGKIGKIMSNDKYDGIKNDTFYTVRVPHEEKENSTISIILLVYSKYLTKIPKITSKQRTVLEALHLLGYNYIACDLNNKSYAFKECPEKYFETRIWRAENEESKLPLSNVNCIMEGICFWEDTKPISISNLLDDINDITK
jgi:hypothetical protein